MWGGNYEAANFNECKLHGTYFDGSLLNFAKFKRATLKGTSLNEITYNKCEQLSSLFAQANIESAYVTGADISGPDYIAPETLIRTLGSSETKLHDSFFENNNISEVKDLLKKLARAKRQSSAPDIETVTATLTDTGFLHWTPYTRNDLGFSIFHQYFRGKYGLSGWPYE